MKAFLVVCPESSGNHMISELLESVGCRLVEYRYNKIPPANSNIVVSMSMPSNNMWFNLEDIIKELKDYDVFTLIGIREWFGTINSQVNRGRVADNRAANTAIQEAYRRIFSTIGYNDFMVVSFDKMVDEPDYKIKILKHLGLSTNTSYVTNRRE